MGKFAISKGTKIWYQIEGQGTPLVLIMGFGADGNVWELHLNEYKKHFKCVVLDNRGVGNSDQPKGPYSTDLMAQDIIAVLDNEKIDQAHIAGISMGGAIAQKLAILYQDRVRSLALISTWPKFNNFAKSMYDNLKRLRKTSEPGDFMQLLQLWIFAPPHFETNLKDLKSGQEAASQNSNPQSIDGFEGQLDACISHDAEKDLHLIKVPTLITVGDLDIMTPPSFSKVLHDGIAGSELVHFPSGGHVHHWEDLDRFNVVTTEFFLKH